MDGPVSDRHPLGNTWNLHLAGTEILLGVHSGVDRNDFDQGNLYHSPRCLRRRGLSRLDLEPVVEEGLVEWPGGPTAGQTYRRRDGGGSGADRFLLLGAFPKLERIGRTLSGVSSLDQDRDRCRRTRQ